MFHVKQIIEIFKNLSLTEKLFLVFLATLSFQTRLILNYDQAFIEGIFSYHKAIFVYLSDIVFIVFLVVWLAVDKTWKQSDWVVILPIIWAFLALFHVEQVDLWIFGILKLLQMLLIIVYLKNSPWLAKKSAILIVIFGIVQALIGIWQFHVQHGTIFGLFGEYVPLATELGAATIRIGMEPILRTYGTMPHPNVLGGFLAISLALLLYVSRETKNPLTNFYVSCGTFILLWGLLLTFSRSAWAVAVIVGVIWIIHLIKNSSIKTSIIWAFFLIVSCGTLVIAYNSYVFPRTSELSNPLNIPAFEYRKKFNNYGLEIIKQQPIIGQGLNQYVPQMEKMYKLEAWQYQPSHNIFAYIVAEIGVIGLLILLYILKKEGFTWNSWKNLANLSLISVILFLGMFDHYLITIQQGKLILAVALGIIISNTKNVSQPVKHLE
jgi:hypothetical protein